MQMCQFPGLSNAIMYVDDYVKYNFDLNIQSFDITRNKYCLYCV